MQKTEILEYACKKRAYDGLWETIGKVLDHENAYTYISQETKQPVTFIPTRWVTVAVTEHKPRI